MALWKTARPSEYLAITGWGIKDVKLAKKALVFVGQRCTRFNITPVNYSVQVEAMSKEKLPFKLPAVFTIGPRVDEESLRCYVSLIGDAKPADIEAIVLGMIEGKTRMLAASMTMDEIFTEGKAF